MDGEEKEKEKESSQQHLNGAERRPSAVRRGSTLSEPPPWAVINGRSSITVMNGRGSRELRNAADMAADPGNSHSTGRPNGHSIANGRRPSNARASKFRWPGGNPEASNGRGSASFMEDNATQAAAPGLQKGMFADGNAMKAQLYENLDQKDYDVTDLYKTTGCAQALARNEHFGNLTLGVIAINACWIGIDADHNKATTLSEAEIQFQVAENFFCVAFTFELGVRFFSFRRQRDCMTDNWFRFDAALVMLMIAETWIIPHALGGGGAGGMSNISILRLLRLLRLTRLVRIMRSIPELITMLKGVAAATRSVAATLSLLMIALYIFSIVFSQQLKEIEELESQYGSIPRCMWTLLLSGTFLDNLTGVLQDIIDFAGGLAPMMVGLFLLFVLISSLTILNMLIGVLCEVVSAVAVAEKEKTVVTYVKAQLIDVLTELDKDNTGTISQEELAEVCENPMAVEALEQLGVDIPNLMNLAEVLFDMEGASLSVDSTGDQEEMDKTKSSASQVQKADDTSGELTFAEFIEMVLRLRSENSASVPDIVDLRKFIRWNNTRMWEKIVELANNIEKEKREKNTTWKAVGSQLKQVRKAVENVSSKMDAVLARARTTDLVKTEVMTERVKLPSAAQKVSSRPVTWMEEASDAQASQRQPPESELGAGTSPRLGASPTRTRPGDFHDI